MPLYQFECEKCGKRTEALMTWEQAIANPAICHYCGNEMTRLVAGRFTFTLAQPNTAKSKVNPNARQVRR